MSDLRCVGAEADISGLDALCFARCSAHNQPLSAPTAHRLTSVFEGRVPGNQATTCWPTFVPNFLGFVLGQRQQISPPRQSRLATLNLGIIMDKRGMFVSLCLYTVSVFASVWLFEYRLVHYLSAHSSSR